MKQKTLFITLVALLALMINCAMSFAEGCGQEEIKVPVYCERTVVSEPARLICGSSDSNFADFTEGCAMTEPVNVTERYVCGTKTQTITKMCPHG
jgi:hypothetical protein